MFEFFSWSKLFVISTQGFQCHWFSDQLQDKFILLRFSDSNVIDVGDDTIVTAESRVVDCIRDVFDEEPKHQKAAAQKERSVLFKDGLVSAIKHEGQVFESGIDDLRLALCKHEGQVNSCRLCFSDSNAIDFYI